MDQRQRIGMQRAMVREAIGKLRAAEELFGVEAEFDGSAETGFDAFRGKVDELERWVFDESAIA